MIANCLIFCLYELTKSKSNFMIEILADLDYFLDEQDGSWLNFQFFASFFFFYFFFSVLFLVDNEEGAGRVSSVGVRMTWNWRVCKRNWVRELTLILLKGLWLTFKQKFACINRITKKSCRQLEERQTEGQLSQIRNDSEVIYYIIF